VGGGGLGRGGPLGDGHAIEVGLTHWSAGSVEERGESGNVQRVLVVSPTERDVMEIRSSGLDIRYDVAFAGPDLDALEHIDAPALAAEADGVEADGIVSSKDRGALFAAALTARRGPPRPAPAAPA